MPLFGRKRGATEPPADVYAGLRQQIVRLTPEQLGVAHARWPASGDRLRASVATLVGVVDGTTTLYFSNGGGVIGAGEHAAVAQATRRRLEAGAGTRLLAEIPLAEL